MLDATTRSGGTATASPRAAATEPGPAVTALPVPLTPSGPSGPVAFAGPAGPAARCARVLLSPWSRLSLLLVLLAAAG
ncbi:hypothetical protein G3I35_29820, partial [Streptomyces sp. SID10815]|nr:hypothetical protein [Streptomyces sp. SID10815]